MKLDDSILTSPRFAIVPQIDLDQDDLAAIGPSTPINIVKFVPVYLQSTWYNCSATECMYFDADDTPATSGRRSSIPARDRPRGVFSKGPGARPMSIW